MTDTIKTLRQALILEYQEIGELASTWKVPKDLFATIIKEVSEEMEQEPEVSDKLSFYHMIQYLCEKAFKHGILTALYVYNETAKEMFNELVLKPADDTQHRRQRQ